MTAQAIADRVQNGKPITTDRVTKLRGCCKRANIELAAVLALLPAEVVADIEAAR